MDRTKFRFQLFMREEVLPGHLLSSTVMWSALDRGTAVSDAFAPLGPTSASTHLPCSSRRGDRSVSREGSRELESDQNVGISSAAGSSSLGFGAEQPPPPFADADTEVRLQPRIQAIIRAARHCGVELDANGYKALESSRRATRPRGSEDYSFALSAADLSRWVQNFGIRARAVRLPWCHLMRLRQGGQVVLLLAEGGAALLSGRDAKANVVYLDRINTTAAAPEAVGESSLAEIWNGEAVLMRAQRGKVEPDQPFHGHSIAGLVLQARRSL